MLDQFGNAYGTTYEGGVYNHGTVYELSPGQNGKWTEKILNSFKGLKDGANPVAGIVFDAAGNIYGTTTLGGTTKGRGTVFRAGDPRKLQLLIRFCGVSVALTVLTRMAA